MGLTKKQTAFVINFLETGNASESYRRSYNCSHMKDTTITRNAHQLLKNSNIATMVEKLDLEEQARLKKKYQIKNDRIIQELLRIALSDITKIFDQDGRLLKLSEIDEKTRLALKDMEVVTRSWGEGEVVYLNKIKMHDKLRALVEVAKIFGMFDKNYRPGPPETPDQADNDKPDHWQPTETVASLIPGYLRNGGNDEKR